MSDLRHEKINYIELPRSDFSLTKQFFGDVFSWEFEEYGDEYLAFHNAGVAGGFYLSGLRSDAKSGSALVIFYSNDLEGTYRRIVEAGGEIARDYFNFPGGRRFHFYDPTGNEYAIWSDH